MFTYVRRVRYLIRCQRRSAALVCLLTFAAGPSAAAQGVQNATLRGVVTDAQNAVMPGVRVTAVSAALQVPRIDVTDQDGHTPCSRYRPAITG